MSDLNIQEDFPKVTFESIVSTITDFTANGSFESLRVNVKYYYEKNYARLIRLTDLRQDLDNDGVYVDEGGFNYLGKSSLQTGDILLANVGEYTGYSCLMPEVSYKATLAPNMFLIRTNENYDNSFLAYVMQGFGFQNQIDRVCASSATKLLNKTNLRKMEIVSPELKKQKKIAKILTTIDQLIEKTQALIDKHTAIKQGMMADLFTRGIDLATGQLRPPAEQAPHLYKETELGWIPKDWEVKKLSKYFSIKHGYAFEGEYFADKPPGEILLTPGNFHRTGGLYFTSNNTKYYTASYSNDYILGKGDYLVVMTDLSPQTLILGRFVYIDNDIPLLHNQRIGKLIAKQSRDWDQSFLIGLLNQEYLRKNIVLTATGTTVRHTSPDRILDSHISIPNSNEQKAIGSILDSNNLRIKTCLDEVAKYEKLKNGLMQDLLTGRVTTDA